ncbi:protein XNDC1N isoform X2 [Paroedura picta]|uniref:protein XNDC1N isoform X2 n=1 Tax=Paroedura picta TaxID=143630 RepID=UPI0040563AAC
MAPVKIKHVVSFTSQDPKYPADNLLLEEGPRPWLSCPQDRSRVLTVELQLEQANHIGYVDIGNCGSAFLQIDVGRSSWPAGQPYLTLLPTAALMMPSDAKRDKNRSGVRMFKEGDFLSAALGQKWDRVRLTSSQPFNKSAQFGLSFIRICTPPDDSSSKADLPSSPAQAAPESTDSPWLSSGAICRTFFPETPASEEVALKTRLQQLDPASSPRTRSPVCLSRPARMVLEAAAVRRRAFPPLCSPPLPAMENKEQGQPSEEGAQSGPGSGIGQGSSSRREPVKPKRRRTVLPCRAGRSVAASSVRPKLGSRRGGRGRSRKGRWQKMESEKELDEEEDSGPERAERGLGTCPICEDHFPAHLLPAHASSCGEEEEEGFSASALSAPASWEELPDAWVSCPICQLRFPAAEVEAHASSCGEPPASRPSWLWVEQGE